VSDPGDWQWPLEPQPQLVRGFEPPSRPWGPGHRGIDLAARPGQPVRAVAAGTVSFAGQVGGTGVVVVRHGRLRSTYQPLVPAVHDGERVIAGAILGDIVTVGSHCLPSACLHLGAREGDRYVDPLSLLEHRPIRLKPLEGLGPSGARPPYAGPTAPARRAPWATLGAWMGLAVGSP
jgi:murein DD-endopeptidase MepM/ murein hydrolase activator NlpD